MLASRRKPLDDDLSRNILIEIGMFQSWTLQNMQKFFSAAELNSLIRSILIREKTKASEDQIEILSALCMMNNDFKEMEKLRSQNGFDQRVVGFCRSIGLPPSYWM